MHILILIKYMRIFMEGVMEIWERIVGGKWTK
jgi:hypothetical protein